MGKQPLDVSPLSIPGCQAVNRKRVSKVMEPWLLADTAIAMDAYVATQNAEVFLDDFVPDPLAGSRREEWVSRLRCACLSIRIERLFQLWADRKQPRLSELRLANRQHRAVQVHVDAVQAKGFV